VTILGDLAFRSFDLDSKGEDTKITKRRGTESAEGERQEEGQEKEITGKENGGQPKLPAAN
jgi:hypothetical protein